jgi:hypothetical protein
LEQIHSNYPDPSERDKDGRLVYETHEAFLIQYYKQFGVTLAVKRILSFIEQQESIINDLKSKHKEDDYSDSADDLYGQI